MGFDTPGITGTNDPLAIPGSATANSQPHSVAVGQGASAGSVEDGATAVGDSATSKRASVAVGYLSNVKDQSVGVGQSATTTSTKAVAIGYRAEAGADSITIGRNIGGGATASRSLYIGANGDTLTPDVGRLDVDQLAFGGTRDTLTDADLNNGELTVELDETNNAFRLRGKDSGGVVREATVAW